ncbi:MAG: hypothetical protein WEC39_02330 [Patescibacteria group bacterium]
MNSISFFNDLGLNGEASFGEEAASLGKLSSAGLPVAPGFVLPNAAYGEFLGQKAAHTLLGSYDPQEPGKFTAAVSSLKLPSRLAAELEGFYRSLSGPRDIRVAVRFNGREERATNFAELKNFVKQAWVKHLGEVAERGGNFYQEPLPILVQQDTYAPLRGTLFTVAPEFGGSDFCLVEVNHPAGKERLVFEKGTNDLVKRTTAGMVGDPTAVKDLADLANWAQKVEQILGSAWQVSFKQYRGEVTFEQVKRLYLPSRRVSSLALWIKVSSLNEAVQHAQEAAGFTTADGELAVSLATSYPNRPVILLLEATDFNQLDRFRNGRHRGGLKNLHLALPPVRTVDGLREVKRYLSGEKIQRGTALKFFFRASYPGNIVLMDQFLAVGVDGVILDEEALAKGFLGTSQTVEPDESLLFAIKETRKAAQAAKAEFMYLAGRARSWILFELVRSDVSALIISSQYEAEHRQALAEAEVERLSQK